MPSKQEPRLMLLAALIIIIRGSCTKCRIPIVIVRIFIIIIIIIIIILPVKLNVQPKP